MKRLLFLCLIPLLTGCEKDMKEGVINELPENEETFVLTEEEAISTLNDFIGGLPETRSLSSLKIINCVKKSPLDFGHNEEIVTRANADNINISSVPIYEITTNSDEGYGFGLVLGDKRFNEAIAFTPKGSLSDTTFNEGLAQFARAIPLLVYESLKAENGQILVGVGAGTGTGVGGDHWQPENPGAYLLDNDPISVEWFNSSSEAYDVYPTFVDPWDTYDTPARYVPVKWHQEAPYNDKAPGVGRNYEITPKIGCATVAMAQVMAFHRRPVTYNWGLITSSQQVKPSQTAAANEVSRLMIDIATAAGTTFNYYADGTTSGSTNELRVVPALSEFGYSAEYLFADREKVSGQMVRDAIVNHGPVLVVAKKHVLNGVEVATGHMWVMDAFYKKSRNYRTLTYGYNNTPDGWQSYAYTTTYRQHFVTIHCNWGWGGSSDGWYFNFTPVNEKYFFQSYHLWSVAPNK